MVDRFPAGGGLRMNVDVRMGDNGEIPGSSILVGELTDTDTALRGGKWLVNSDVAPGGKMRIPSNLTRGESVVDNCDNRDGDIGASSKKQKF